MSTEKMFNGVKGVVAEYKSQEVKEYSNNPFIESLPKIMSVQEAAVQLSEYPIYDPREKNIEDHNRVHIIQRLFQVFQALPIHLDLESRVSRTIRQGYISRNPLNPKYVAHMNNTSVAKILIPPMYRTSSTGFFVIGVSGMGKSTAISRIMRLYPQVIIHSKYIDTTLSVYQVVWLKIDCPYDGSLKGLCLEFFRAMDDLLGTNNFEKYSKGSRHSVDTMLVVIAKIAQNVALGVLIVDEIQHLNTAKSGGPEKMLNYFVTLVNTIGVPVILIGTPKALGIIQSEFRQARRGSGQGDVTWDRLEKGNIWDLFINGIWQYQWIKKEVILTKEMSDLFYEESQGIIDIAIKLFAMEQIEAIITGGEKITSGLITKVSEKNLKLVRPMLQSLKKGSFKDIAKYEDIVIDFDKFMFSMDYNIERKKIEILDQAKNKVKNKESVSKDATEKLLAMNLDRYLIQKAIKDLEKSKIYTNSSELAFEVIKEISKPRSRGEKSCHRDENYINNVISKGERKGLNAYQSLKEVGIIKDGDSDPLWGEV